MADDAAPPLLPPPPVHGGFFDTQGYCNLNTDKALSAQMKRHHTATIPCSDRTCVRKFDNPAEMTYHCNRRYAAIPM